VFARRNIKKGTIFCCYTGYLVSKKVAGNRHSNTDYVIEGVSSEGVAFFVDAQGLECLGLGKYINDIINDHLVNAKIVCNGIEIDVTSDGLISLSVKASDDIRKGDEVYISYGRVYWMSRLHLLEPSLAASVIEEFA
jgi:hypothetical protein